MKALFPVHLIVRFPLDIREVGASFSGGNSD
jgi:hypothetical protein